MLEEFARNSEAERTAESEAAPDGTETEPVLSDDEIRGKIKEELETANPDLLNGEFCGPAAALTHWHSDEEL